MLAGGLALVDAAGLVDVSVPAGLALALLLVGGALLVGARWGRGRLLIPVGLLLTAALVAVSVVDVPLRGGVGERDHRPQTLVELDSPYRLAAGELTVDLRRLDLAGVTSRVVASVGAGELLVIVPDDVALDVVAEVGAGELEVLHRHDEGLGVQHRAVERGREGQGELVLRVRVGVGQLEVRRAAA